MKNNNIKLFSLIVMAFLLVTLVQFLPGCKPSSGDYGVFDLRSDKPEVPAGTPITATLVGKIVDDADKKGQDGLAIRMFSTDKTPLREMSSVVDGSFQFTDVAPGTYLLEVAEGSTRFDTATYTVLVNPDGTVLPADISLPVYLEGSSKITADMVGKVVDNATKTGQHGVSVRMFSDDKTLISEMDSVVGGSFLFSGVEPGTYLLEVANGSTQFNIATYTMLVKPDGTVLPANISLPVYLKDNARITASLAGKVVDGTSKSGLSGVSVRMLDVNKTLLREMDSLVDGSFQFTDVAPGIYLFEVANGSTQFDTAIYSALINPDGTVVPSDIALPLYLKGSSKITATLVGKVVDSVSKIGQHSESVRLLDANKTLISEMNSVADGSFLFSGVEPGDYILEVAKGSTRFATGIYGVLVNPDGTVLPANISLPVYLKGSSEISTTLAGKVVDGTSQIGQHGVSVRLLDANKTLISEMDSLADGSFSFAKVEPGTYLLEVANGSTQFDTAIYSALINPDGTVLPDDIMLAVHSTGFSAEMLVDIHGQVTASTTTILEDDVDVSLFRVINTVPEATAIATAKTQAMGLFLFPQQKPGIYQVELTKPGRADKYALIVYNDGTSIPEIPMQLILGD